MDYTDINTRNPVNKKRKVTDDTKSGKLGSQNDKKQSDFADILENLQDDADQCAWLMPHVHTLTLYSLGRKWSSLGEAEDSKV